MYSAKKAHQVAIEKRQYDKNVERAHEILTEIEKVIIARSSRGDMYAVIYFTNPAEPLFFTESSAVKNRIFERLWSAGYTLTVSPDDALVRISWENAENEDKDDNE